MKIVRTTDLAYKPYSEEYGLKGIERADLWRDGQNVSFDLFRIKKGADYAEHTHDSWEIMFVVSGKINLSGEILGPGDFVFTEPGESHTAENLEDTVVLLGFGKHYD